MPTLTSEKSLTLKNIKHVLSISKNLVSESLLYDAGMRLHFQGEQVVLPYKKIYFGNAYRTYDMDKISTTVPNSVINEISTSVHSFIFMVQHIRCNGPSF